MEIGPLATPIVVSLGPGHRLIDAARKMHAHQVGSAIVHCEDGAPGIITERDLLRAIAQGTDPEVAVVEDFMTPNAMTASASWDVLEAARRMLQGGFRHLIVLDDEGNAAGVLSIRDIFKVCIDQFASPSTKQSATR